MMRIWIDIDTAAEAQPLFGLHPVERHLRAIATLDPAPDAVVLSGTAPLPDTLGHPVRRESGPAGQRLAGYLAAVDGPVLAFEGGAYADPRLVRLLAGEASPAAFRGEGAASSVVLRLTSATPPPRESATLVDAAAAMAAEGRLCEIGPRDLPRFVTNLRREVPLTLERVPDEAARARLERQLFRDNYKGSTDFLTKWVYPPLVWPLVRLATRHRIHPNWLTVASVVLAFAAVPLFAAGAWGPGLACAYVMTVLDSVDGKVARLTLTQSSLGNLLDHGLDIVHPPLWYAAWAWGLGASPGEPLHIIMLWLIAFYVGDRLVLMVAKARFGRGLHAVTRLDGRVRTWIARRNTNLVIFTVALVLGHGAWGFVAVTAWQGLTMAWHAVRTAWLFPASRHRRLPA